MCDMVKYTKKFWYHRCHNCSKSPFFMYIMGKIAMTFMFAWYGVISTMRTFNSSPWHSFLPRCPYLHKNLAKNNLQVGHAIADFRKNCRKPHFQTFSLDIRAVRSIVLVIQWFRVLTVMVELVMTWVKCLSLTWHTMRSVLTWKLTTDMALFCVTRSGKYEWHGFVRPCSATG